MPFWHGSPALYFGGKTKSLKEHYARIVIKPCYKHLVHLAMSGVGSICQVDKSGKEF